MKRACLISLLVAVGIAAVVIIFVIRGCESNHKVERGPLITEGPVNEAWKNDYYKGKWMRSNAITIDDAGYVYATGSGTVKYDGDGKRLWKSRKHGFVGKDIVADNKGNVYVTGANHDDYMTIKYDGDGDEIWSVRYNGPGDSYDTVTGIAMDQSGNVLVTGGSIDIDNRYDYVTVKYDSRGNQLWLARYGCPSGTDCVPCNGIATSIAIDESGNIFVTGNGLTETGSDVKYWEPGYVNPERTYLTIKYDSEGNELWAKRYKGHYARGVALDTYSNIYVSGDSGTIKYNNDGDLLWDIPQGGRALACDDEGNIYIDGIAEESREGETRHVGNVIKFDSNGDKVWSAPVPPDVDYWSYPFAITVDNSGNVYAVGNYGTVVKYSSEGQKIWASYYQKVENQTGSYESYKDIAVDKLGNVYVTGDFTYDIREPFNLDFTSDNDIYYNSCTVAKFVQSVE